MLDAFGGCCVYDESARHQHESCGVLGWLIAGAAGSEGLPLLDRSGRGGLCVVGDYLFDATLNGVLLPRARLQPLGHLSV